MADLHERSSGIGDALRRLGAEVDENRLPVADYALPGGVLVERKSVRDLHQSVVSGTFWRQLGALRRSSARPFLLVEGDALYDGPLAAAAIRGTCLAVIEQGIRLLRSEGRDDSAAWLYQLARRAATKPKRDRPTYAQRPQPRSPAEAAEGVLAAVPGISVTTARALLAHFGSVAAVLAADQKKWLEVPGIGPERARALAQTLAHHRQSSS